MRRKLVRRLCLDTQGVNIGLHQIVERGIYEAVACKKAFACESGADHLHSVVSLTARGTRVTAMQVALVFYVQARRLEFCQESLADPVYA